MPASFDPINIISGTLNIGSGTPYDIILSDTSGNPTVFNQNNQDIDFAISGLNSFLYYDASTGRLGIGDKNPDASLHIIAPCANDGLKLEGTTDCPTGVRILLLHNPGIAPQSGSYPSTIDLAGHDTNSQTIYYGQIRSRILDPVTGQTSGELLFNVDHTGSLETVFRANIVDSMLGGLNVVSGSRYSVVGSSNLLQGSLLINLGTSNSGALTSGLLIGNNSRANGSYVILVGNESISIGNNVLLVGSNTSITGNNNIVVANNSRISGTQHVILGDTNIISSTSNNILGLFNNANIIGSSGVGLGSSVTNNGNSNVFLGNNNTIVGSNSYIIGSEVSVTGNNNLIYGANGAVNGSNIVTIGNTNSAINVTSGLLVGNNIGLENSTKSVVMGLGNSIDAQFSNSLLIGVTNDTSAGNANALIMIGQNNISSDISNSLVVGNNNNASGVVKNNIVLGPDNFTSSTSNNNIIIGTINNNTGLGITSNGTVSGVSAGLDGIVNNSLIFGIQNITHDATNASVIGNKNQVSGNNLNSIGSFNNIKQANDIQNIGNSNFILGNYTNIFGSKITSIGSTSIINNPSKRPVYSFGSGNILFGDNEIVISGICIGDNNDLLGANNIVYGKNNFVGETRNPCSIDGSSIAINGDVRSNYIAGDRVLVLLNGPASESNIFYRLVDVVAYDNVLGITTLTLTEGISAIGLPYGVRSSFDGNLVETETVQGWVMPYQDGNDLEDLVGDPLIGNSNIIIGSNNQYVHSGGIVLGSNNNITGVNNVVIGSYINGLYNNSLQIGTSNDNKVYLDDSRIVFNTGAKQDYFILRSRLAGSTLYADLSQNRIGVNNVLPRSTLDVSGTITTTALRVGLTSTPGYSLISDASGNATWQFPVNLSGIDTGILYRINNKVASGIEEFRFVNSSKHLGYLKPASNGDPSLEDAFTLTPSGLFINNSALDDESVYNVYMKGSGIGLIEGQQDHNLRINLFKTLPEFNAIQVYNITGVSGHFYRHTITDTVYLPTSLTGTLLNVSSTDGLLSARVITNNCVLFANRSSFASGNNDFKFFSENKALTIGTTGLLTNEQQTNFQGATDISSNVILCSTSSYGSVINNAGHNQPFSIIDFTRASITDRYGMHYWTSGGVLGLGVTPSTTMQATNGSAATLWYTHPNVKLNVNGKIKTNGLQLTQNGAFPPDASARYLRADDDGNVTLSALNLNTQFSGIWPLYIDASIASRVDIGISTRSLNSNTPYSANGNGFTLVYNGNNWINNARGVRFYQPDFLNTDDDAVPGLILGPGGRKNSCNNSHVFAGTPFMDSTIDTLGTYLGSNQMSKFYLKGRTTNNADTELVSNYSKHTATPSPDSDNCISIQKIYNPNTSNNYPDWNGTSVWLYNIKFCGLVAPVDGNSVETKNFKGVAGTLEGACVFYRNDAGVKVFNNLGTPNITVYKSSDLTWTEDPIYVTGISTDSVQRLAIKTRGLSNCNILWDATVDIQQLNHPSGYTLAGNI